MRRRPILPTPRWLPAPASPPSSPPAPGESRRIAVAASAASATSGDTGMRPTIAHLNSHVPSRKNAGPPTTTAVVPACGARRMGQHQLVAHRGQDDAGDQRTDGYRCRPAVRSGPDHANSTSHDYQPLRWYRNRATTSRRSETKDTTIALAMAAVHGRLANVAPVTRSDSPSAMITNSAQRSACGRPRHPNRPWSNDRARAPRTPATATRTRGRARSPMRQRGPVDETAGEPQNRRGGQPDEDAEEVQVDPAMASRGPHHETGAGQLDRRIRHAESETRGLECMRIEADMMTPGSMRTSSASRTGSFSSPAS